MRKSKKTVHLRALTTDDLDRLLRWHNNYELYSTLGGHFRYVGPEAEADWLRRRLEARDEVNLAVCLSEPPEHIGNVYLRNIDWVHRNAELHIFLAEEKHRGKGYGSAAIRLLIKHAFEDLGLVRIYLYTLASNIYAVKSYERCGFSLEGRLKRHAFKNGVFEDILVMGLCRD
jgi:diamine N-acetyltransferase